MAFIPTPNCVRASLNFRCNQQNVVNTLWFEFNSGTPSEDDMLALGVVLEGWYVSEYRPLISHEAVLRDITITSQESDSAPSVTHLVSATNGPGGGSGGAEPNNVTLCVSFRTAGRGRSARGRNYIVGLPDGQTSGNQALPSYVTDIQAAYVELLALIGSSVWTWVIVSHFHNKTVRPAGLPQPVTAAVVIDGNIDSQRRRLTGRGT